MIGALFAAGIVAVLIAVAASVEVAFTGDDVDEARVWSALPGGAAVLAGALVALATAYLALTGLRGGARFHLAGLPARPPASPAEDRLANVVDALCLGLGIPRPTLQVIDDPAPNAISGRDRRGPRLLVTSGAIAELGRDELEAMCAHELGHLHTADARLIGAAFVTLLRVHTLSKLALGGGGLLVAGGIQTGVGRLLALGVGIAAVSALAVALLSRPLWRLRRDTDDVADCVAVRLSRHPQALVELLDRLVADQRQVACLDDANTYLWFETVADRFLAQRRANAAATAAGQVAGRF